MSSIDFKRVETLFQAAAAMDSADRSAFLTRECNGDDQLRTEVEALLSHDDQPVDYFRTPVLDAGVTLREHVQRVANVPPEMPARIGAYRILDVIGEGGFGVVYLAEQDLPRRTVALKVLRPSLTTRSVLKRFEYEAQVLGRLQHVGIAQIYEAGTAEAAGRRQAFVAMEYIQGKPLTNWANDRRIGTRDRLELVAKVCDAVQHAHQKGIIHRDLKPANILVDDSGQPKILDFGVARAADPQLTSATLQTLAGQLVGTLPYMSPEQAGGDPNEIDTRSDVYAIGVILYELLSGRLPYDLGSNIPDAARAIRERPHTRLSSLNRVFRGEVDTIVSEALEKEKSRRYQSAAALAEDIRRFLAGEPISAKRDSALYVLKKQLRRHWAAAAAALLFILLLAGFGVYAWGQSRIFEDIARREGEAKHEAILASRVADRAKIDAETARDSAQRERQRADRSAERLAGELSISNIERGRLTARNGVTSTAEGLIWREHLCNPDSLHTYWALWEMYANAPWLVNAPAHSRNVNAIAYHPAGQRLITGGEDGQICVWETVTWQPLTRIDAHDEPIMAAGFSGDGELLATQGRDGRLIIWNFDDLSPRHVLPGFWTPSALACAPNGPWLASAGTDSATVVIWNMELGTPVSVIPASPRGVTYVAFSQDGESLAITARDATARVYCGPWDSPRERLAVRQPTGGAASAAFTADSRYMFLSGADRQMRAWDLETGRSAVDEQSPSDTISRVQPVPGENAVASVGWWSIDFWGSDPSQRRGQTISAEGVANFTISPDGRCIAAGLLNGALRVYERRPEGAFKRFNGQEGRTAALLSPDGRILATGDGVGTIRLWDTVTDRLLAAWKGHNARIHCLQFDPTGPRLITGADDRVMKIWNLTDGSCIESFSNFFSRSIGSARWSPDGRWFVYMTTERHARLVNAQTMQKVAELSIEFGEPLGLAVSPDGEYIAVISRDALMRVWSRSGRVMATLSGFFTPWCCDFSPDGRWLAVGGWSQSIHVFDWRNEAYVAQLEGHSATVWTIDFHPTDPRLLVSAASDGSVRLWDVSSQLCLLTLDNIGDSEVLTTGFSGDGRRLAATNSTGTAAVWDLNYFEPHVAGQIEYQISRFGLQLGSAIKTTELREWAAQVRARWARPVIPKSTIDPQQVWYWGRLLPADPAGATRQ